MHLKLFLNCECQAVVIAVCSLICLHQKHSVWQRLVYPLSCLYLLLRSNDRMTPSLIISYSSFIPCNANDRFVCCTTPSVSEPILYFYGPFPLTSPEATFFVLR